MRWLVGIALGALASLFFSAPLLAHDGCHLSVEPQGGNGFFLIVGTDFAPNEEIELQALFSDVPVFPDPVLRAADDTGTLSDGITLTDEDPEGDYLITATANSCTAEAPLRWGGLPDTATEAPESEEALPLGLAVAVGAGLLVFGYLFIRPSKISGRKD
jgi:hypothetical protein